MTRPTATSLSAAFPGRAGAERALAALRAAAIPGLEAEIAPACDPDQGDSAPSRGVTDAPGSFPSPGARDAGPARDPKRVVVTGATGEGLERAIAILRDAGGVTDLPDDGAPPQGEPGARPVQPGFADARPGMVPRAAEYPQDRPETRQPRGRFADQLDRLPDGPRDDDGE